MGVFNYRVLNYAALSIIIISGLTFKIFDQEVSRFPTHVFIIGHGV